MSAAGRRELARLLQERLAGLGFIIDLPLNSPALS